MNRIDQVIELAGRLARKREEAAALQAELEALLGRDQPEAAEPVKTPRPVVEKAAATTNGNGVKRGERMAQVAELAKEGLGPTEIAARLGISQNAASVALVRARKNHLVPKAEKRQ